MTMAPLRSLHSAMSLGLSGQRDKRSADHTECEKGHEGRMVILGDVKGDP